MQHPIVNYMMHGSDNFSNFITHNEKRYYEFSEIRTKMNFQQDDLFLLFNLI